jgi:intracellular septation protein
MSEPTKKEMSQGLKLALDFLPLVAFFAAYRFGNMYVATGVIIVLTLVSLAISYFITGKVAKFPLFSAILITILGGLTLYLQDDTFVKMKPTAANLIFAGLLGGGLLMNRMFLKDLLGATLNMPEDAWRTLTLRWTVFFLVLAGLNEYVWRTMSEEAWVNFKVFGLMGLTLVFALANAPFMARFMKTETDNPSADG